MVFESLCNLIRHSPFILFNFIVPTWGIFGIITSSGLTLSPPKTENNQNTVDIIITLNYIFPLLFIFGCLIGLFRMYFQQGNKNWWNISLIVEKVKESKIFKTCAFSLGFSILILQICAWYRCLSIEGDCIMNFHPRSQTPISSDQYMKLFSFMKDNKCDYYKPYYNWLTPENITNQTITLDMYLDLQQECYQLTEKCKPVCFGRFPLLNFIYSALTGLFVLYLSQSYDGSHQDIPHHLKVFDKLKIPKYKFKCLSFPKFWSSPFLLIKLLLPMLLIQQSCNEDSEEFEQLKEKYSELPWDWVRGFNKKDFEELKVILPLEQKKISPFWEITGPISKLYKPLKQLCEIRQLEGNDLFHSLKTNFFIFLETPMKIVDQEDQSITVLVLCWENKTFFCYNGIQFELSEIQKMMGFEHEDCFEIKFRKKNVKKHKLKNLIRFNDQNVKKFFPIFMQKIQEEQQVKQEGEIQLILTSQNKKEDIY